MKYILFIESVKEKEWEVGAIINNDIVYNPDYSDTRSDHVKIKNSKELKQILTEFIIGINEKDYVIVHIDAHSNQFELGFRNDPDIDDTHNIQPWGDVVKMCNSLFGKFYERALFVFASCLSALYFKDLPFHQYNIIAAENEVDPRRMKEQLLVFYKSFCFGNSFEHAYDDMIQRFPIEDELKRDKKEQSILRFYSNDATSTT